MQKNKKLVESTKTAYWSGPGEITCSDRSSVCRPRLKPFDKPRVLVTNTVAEDGPYVKLHVELSIPKKQIACGRYCIVAMAFGLALSRLSQTTYLSVPEMEVTPAPFRDARTGRQIAKVANIEFGRQGLSFKVSFDGDKAGFFVFNIRE